VKCSTELNNLRLLWLNFHKTSFYVLRLYRDRVANSGELEFCFDNSFSHISSKTVFFRIAVAADMTTTADTMIDGTFDAQELLPFEITLENFKVFLS